MKIILDENAGFCFGVLNAVNKTFDLIENNTEKNIFTFGPLIHNNSVIQKLKDNNVESINNLSELDKNSILIIRSHGIPEDLLKNIEEKNVEYYDFTCPYVSKIHKLVKKYYEEKYTIFIIGDSEHPEVVGINGWCNNSAIIIDNEKIVDKLPIYDKICLVAQTTITKEQFAKIIEKLKSKYSNLLIFDTICSATDKRQKSAAEISSKVDLMIVIGGSESSNTKRLYETCKRYCENTIQVETVSDLPLNISFFNAVGITAGASTPDWIIKEVVSKMEEIIKENLEDQASMMEEYEKSMKSLYPGQTVKGSVIYVTDNEVMVNVGYKADGIIKRDDFTWDNEASLKSLINPGDEIEVSIVSINDGDGNVVLSKKLADAEKNLYKIEEAFNEKTIVEGTIREIVRGGAVVEIFGAKAFLPASQFDMRYTEDLTPYLNTKISVHVIEYDPEKRKTIVSRKSFLKIAKDVAEKKAWETIAEGQKLKGEVKRLTDFGAFVDIGGVDGLIHISELSWNRIKHPSEIVKEGETVEVVVLNVDREKKKISLGMKQMKPEPWTTVQEKYNVGDIVDVKVLRFTNFGAFVEIESGIDGLVHISQISEKRIAKPADVLTIGQIVKAKILEIKLEEKKISLSIKEAADKVEAE